LTTITFAKNPFSPRKRVFTTCHNLFYNVVVHCQISFDNSNILCYYLLQNEGDNKFRKKYNVKLTEKERKQLINLTRRGKSSSARQLNRARVLLLSDENRPKGSMPDSEMEEIFSVSSSTIHRIRRRYANEGLFDSVLMHCEISFDKNAFLCYNLLQQLKGDANG
jgi:hypothetical protein